MSKFLFALSSSIVTFQNLSLQLIRIAIAIVLIWIGGLKFFNYEAEGIVPFVANSPVMYFFYSDPSGYKNHMSKEGELNKTNQEWHKENNTYAFSYGLGALLIIMGIVLLLDFYNPVFGIVGSLSVIIMSVVTLSFLITTPETWVPALGDTDTGFPFLSGRGRLVVKDIIMMAGAFTVLCDSAKHYLHNLPLKKTVAF